MLYVRYFLDLFIRLFVNIFVDLLLKFPSSRIMLLGNIRRETYSDYRTNLNAAHLISSLTTPLSASSTTARTPITSQQTPTTYARTSYRYTTVRLFLIYLKIMFFFLNFLGYIAFFTTTNGNNNISRSSY